MPKNRDQNIDPRIETLKLTIPIGPTDNRRRGLFRGRLIDTSEYRAWKQAAFYEIKRQLPLGWQPIRPSEAQQLPYIMEVFLPSRRMDAANYDKGVRDVLKIAGVWTDDKWTLPQFRPIVVAPKAPRIIVTIPLTITANRLMWPIQGLENVLVV